MATEKTQATEAEVQQTTLPAEETKPVQTDKKKKRKKVRRKGSIVKKIIVWLIILILLAAAAWGIYMLFFKEEEKIALTDKTFVGSLDRSIEGSGTTVATETYSVNPASRADIEKVYVQVGDKVKEGDLLYEQDDSEVDTAIAQYESQIDTYNDEIADYELSILEQETNISDYNLKILEYQQKIAEVNKSISNMTVRAPFAGRISKVSVEVGDTVRASQTLCTIIDDSYMTLEEYFSYAYEDKVYVGMPATVSVASQMLSLEGTVTAVSKIERITSEGMRCFSVTVTITNPGVLSEGTAASCCLVADDGTKVYPSIDGTLKFPSTKTITAEAEGEILKVNVSDYDTVSKNTILFTIDAETLNDQVENYEKQITTTEKQITSAEKQITNYYTKIEQTQEKIEDLEEDIEDLEETRSDYAVCSEIDGTVMYVNISVGNRPNMNQTAVTVYNLEQTEISVNFDELDVDYVQEGTAITIIRTSSKQETYYNGTVTYLSPEATSSNGVSTFAATITIDSNGELASGVTVSYRVAAGDTEEGTLAPLSALKTYNDQYYLYVKSDTRPDNAEDLIDPDVEVPEGFYAVPVEVGNSNDSYIRILSGLEGEYTVFTRYRNTAPSNGNVTSSVDEETDETSFGDMSGFTMPDMSGFSSGNSGNSDSNRGGGGGGNMGGGGMR